MATDAETLLEDACASGVSKVAPTQLWIIIAQALTDALSTTAEQLLEDACASGIADVAPEQLLILIAEAINQGGGGGGGSGQIKTYLVDPNGEAVVPDDQTKPAVAYQVSGAGPTVTWNTGTLLWQ